LNGSINPNLDFSIVPIGSWLFTKEGRDKPGWVTQHPFPSHTLVIPLNITNLFSWLTGKTKQERLERLNDRDIVIVFSYLKSYEDMLTVSLQLCNHTVSTESVMWSIKFSLSYTSVLPIGFFIEQHCDDYI
jgi:hypothetical protein